MLCRHGAKILPACSSKCRVVAGCVRGASCRSWRDFSCCHRPVLAFSSSLQCTFSQLLVVAARAFECRLRSIVRVILLSVVAAGYRCDRSACESAVLSFVRRGDSLGERGVRFMSSCVPGTRPRWRRSKCCVVTKVCYIWYISP